jgi:2-(1,2-epoxy-1,2-dihydrophenyl)acetyl-CoA isomerase
MSQTLLTETIGAVRILTLNRPERLNALDSALLAALNQAFEDAAATPAVRAVLLTAAGRGFCAGADLTQGIDPANPNLGALIEAYYNPLVHKMRNLPKPVVVAINGVAAGAGMNLALAGDILIAGETANFTQAFIRIGLLPDAGGTYFLPRLIGEGRARALAMLGETITAAQALEYGLLWQVVPDDMLMTQGLTIATNLAAKPAQAMAAIKQAFSASLGNTLDTQLTLERNLQNHLGATPDFAEGVTAFLEKRPAKFN